MSYIGKTPTVGNFQVCDAISVVNNQAAYTMQVGGVNVSPESANHMIVSLNGVIQKPTDAYTVSNSVISFASNLVTGDVINFIQILGNVLDLGVPSDATVSTAKIVDGAVTSAKLASGAVQNQSAFKNIIINGDMSIAQRGTSTSSITGNGYHTIDRFNTVNTTLGTWTQSQDTTVPTGEGFATSLKMDCTTADASPAAGDRLDIQQKFEGQNLQYLKKGTASAESLTLSFWVYATKTGTNIVELFDNDNSRQISQAYTISSSNTWEKKTLTFAGDTSGALGNDNGSSLQVSWFLAVGSNYSSGTLNTSWNSNTNANRAVGQVNHADSTSNNFYITGIQLEAGTTASDFEFLPVDVNLQRCQRYFLSLQGASSTAIGSGISQISSASACYINFITSMRSSPTATYSALGITDATNYAANVSSIQSIESGTTGARIIVNHASSATALRSALLIVNDANAYLHLNSEL